MAKKQSTGMYKSNIRQNITKVKTPEKKANSDLSSMEKSYPNLKFKKVENKK